MKEYQIVSDFVEVADEQARELSETYPENEFWDGNKFFNFGLEVGMEVIPMRGELSIMTMSRFYIPELDEILYFYSGMVEEV